MLRLVFILFFCLCWLSPVRASVGNLQVEYLTNPIGIDVSTPRFSWQSQSRLRGFVQTAYRIVVSDTEDFSHIVWDSGKVPSDKSLHITYAGPALSPSTRYYWKVTVWNNKDGRETSEEKAFFETGLLGSGWSGAQWIRATPVDCKSDTDPDVYRNQKGCMTLETDVTITSGNASVVFGAKTPGNMFMWSVNTLDNKEEPLIRRHVYANGQLTATDTPIGRHFSKDALLGKEFRLKITARDGKIDTYINDTLVDTYEDTAGLLHNGFVGIRAFRGENSNETALYDNFRYTAYALEEGKEISLQQLDDDFEGGDCLFEGGKLVDVDGNHKLEAASPGNVTIWFQRDMTAVPMFRKEFRLRRKIASARIYSSALGVYDLFINGRRVGTPQSDGSMTYDELKPGWTDYKKTVFYQTYDVTSLLRKGWNAIGAAVSSGWFTGDVSHGEYGANDLGFLAKLVVTYKDGSTDVVVTDTSWLSSTSGPLRLGDIYHGETYDARMESRWTEPGYNARHWNKTAVNPYFKGQTIGYEGPAVRVRPEMTRAPLSVTIYNGETNHKINVVTRQDNPTAVMLKKGETAVYDLGQNMVGWPKFTVKGAGGTAVKMRFGEMLNDTGDGKRGDDGPAGSIYTANLRSARATLKYILKGDGNGETFRPSMTFFGFRYCEVTADADIELSDFEGQVVGSVNPEGSFFKTSNSLVNQLYSNVVWGQRGNYLSIPTDCPQRDERLGWTGDAQVFVRTGTYNANVAPFFEKWMRDMRDSQREDGAYPGVAPHNWGVPFGGTAWADAGIIVPWTIYLVYADRKMLEDNYSSMSRYMEYLSTRKADGYLYNGGETTWGDWLAYEGTDNRYISVCYYAYVAQLMAKISDALSREDGDRYALAADSCRQLYGNIRNEFIKRYVDEQGQLKQKSQTAYLLALKMGLFPNEEAARVGMDSLVVKIACNGNRLSTGFVGTGILNQTLSQYGSTATAYNLLLQRENPSWMYSIDQGATTIWERWDSYTKERGFNTVAMNSFNHYSYGAVAEWMFSVMAGIDVDERQPGYKHVILHPEPDFRTVLPAGQERITWVDASYRSAYGDIKSSWKMETGGSVVYKFTLPANTSATLVLPLHTADCTVTEGGVPLSRAEGVSGVSTGDGKVRMELQSGTYEFTVKKL